MFEKIINWLMNWEKPNKFHPSIHCNCPDCNTTTDLQIR